MSIEFDPFSTHLGADPYPLYRELREQGPVHHSTDSDIYCVTRYEEVRWALNQPELFSSRAMETVFSRSRDVSFKLRHVMQVMRFVWRMRAHLLRFRKAGNLITLDPPRHGELRSIVNRGFTPRQIAKWEPWIREIVVEEVADKLAGAADFDAMRDLAIPLPTRVIMQVLGVEKNLRSDFKRWSDAIISGISGPGRHDPLELGIIDTMSELMLFLAETVRERRASPGEDLISLLVDPKQGHALGDAEAISFVILLLVAGNETTTNLIGTAVSLLLDHPETLDLVVSEPARISALIEEVLRFDAPVHLMMRRAKEDLEIAGLPIPRDGCVALLIGAANRDDREFSDPDRFDITREPKPPLAFGQGAHLCLGASLARLEARAVLELLIPELPGLCRTTSRRQLVDSTVLRGLAELPLRAKAG